MVVIAGERRRVAMDDQCRWALRVPPFTARTLLVVPQSSTECKALAFVLHCHGCSGRALAAQDLCGQWIL
jgi:poly(3-hydroxybutyrate) depolymerase